MAAAAVVLGKIVAVTPEGGVRVELPDAAGARAARLAAPLSQGELLAAMQAGRSVVLAFENGDPALPIVIAVMQAPAAGAVPLPASGATDAATSSQRDPASPRVIEANVDGKRVRIVAQDEIVLECGSASITLRRNGRVVVRGTYVETYSEGTNRIKGGQVRIN